MKHPGLPSLRLLSGLLAVLLCAAPGVGRSAEPAETRIRVEDPWIRWLPAGLPGASYLSLVNLSGEPVDLIGAASPDYASIEMHRSFQDGAGNMQMEPVTKVTIPAGGRAELRPGGYHLMMMGARRPLKPGMAVVVTLRFSDGRELTVAMPVRPANTTGG